MIVFVDTYVPEGADFIDGGWEPMKVDIPAVLSLREVIRAINTFLASTEVESFRWNGKVYAVR